MSEQRLGQIVTFYSYKGGVGRSMALANVAVLLAQRGERVLAIDFDLEAPGLHRYFLRHDTPLGEGRYRPVTAQLGVIDFFHEFEARLRGLSPDPAADARDPMVTRQLTGEIVEALLDSEQYLYRIAVADPNRAAVAAGEVSFMAAGRLDDAYASRVHDFDWRRFYARHGEALEVFSEVLRRRYDWVLIDSRTGVADIASVCTVLLPDKLVLVFSPSEQALEGALEIGRQAARSRSGVEGRPRLALLPLLSRVEDGEEELKRAWVEKVGRRFSELYEPSDEQALRTYFHSTRVPHRSYYAYGEWIAAEQQPTIEVGSLTEVFSRFIGYLELSTLAPPLNVPPEAPIPRIAAILRDLLRFASQDSSSPALQAEIYALRKELAELYDAERVGRLKELLGSMSEPGPPTKK
ncbi:MAG TPA: AAA family ATPase [Polyangia bacterium]|jgi:Mrp family chromosome partitioning ATPase|nr:AAA family ATPase [Polyangia bacterium]